MAGENKAEQLLPANPEQPRVSQTEERSQGAVTTV